MVKNLYLAGPREPWKGERFPMEWDVILNLGFRSASRYGTPRHRQMACR